MIITLCTEFSPGYSMLQTSAVNQTKQLIISFRVPPASGRHICAEVWKCCRRERPIAPVGSLPDNGARTGRVHGDTEQSFSAAQRIYCAAVGRAADLAGGDGPYRTARAARGCRGAWRYLYFLGSTGGYAARTESCATGDHDSRR